MKRWRLLEDPEFQEPSMAMAIEEAVLRAVEKGLAPNVLRFWRNKNAVIIGRFQCPKSEVVFDSCLRYGTTLVRRFTGGGAVYHDDGNLNFAISISRGKLVSSELFSFFRIVGRAVAKSLKNIGLPAEFKDMNVDINGRKISGMAGKVTEKSMFIHGSLLINSNLNVLSRVLKSNQGKRKEKFVPSIVKKVTTIRNELGCEVPISEVKEALMRSFEDELGVFFVKRELTEEELKLAEILYNEKYSRTQWILATCKECPELITDAPVIKYLSFR